MLSVFAGVLCGDSRRRWAVHVSVTTTRELEAAGLTRNEVSRLNRRGELVRVRRGAYATEAVDSELERHRRLIAATWPLLEPGSVLSHASAGVLHQLPTWTDSLTRVSVIRRSAGHGSRRTNLHVRLAALEEPEIIDLAGYQVTTTERTAIDLGCVLGFERAVAVLDAALRMGSGPELLSASASGAARRRGAATARVALAFADSRSESVAESISRVRMAQVKLPTPELQVNVFNEDGEWQARSDFGWLERGVLGEFDGKIKYLGSEKEVATAVMKEKFREARLRELGWVVVRWDWADLKDGAAFRRRIESAFAQANPARIRGWAVPS